MDRHLALPIERCRNPQCQQFDRWQMVKQAARLIPESAEHLAALPPVPVQGYGQR